jgi:hypothetical protein
MAEAAAPAGGRVVAPDGTVSYDFDGHIHAKGLDLPAAPAVFIPENVPTDSRVSWVAADGGLVARIWGDTRGLSLYTDGTLMARAGGASRVVLSDDGSSDFAMAADIADMATTGYVDGSVGALDADVDVRLGDRVLGAGLEVRGQFSVPLSVAGGNLTTHIADIALDGIVGTWPQWAIAGYWSGNGLVALGSVQYPGGSTARFFFVSLVAAGSLQSIFGSFFFYVIGRP